MCTLTIASHVAMPVAFLWTVFMIVCLCMLYPNQGVYVWAVASPKVQNALQVNNALHSPKQYYDIVYMNVRSAYLILCMRIDTVMLTIQIMFNCHRTERCYRPRNCHSSLVLRHRVASIAEAAAMAHVLDRSRDVHSKYKWFPPPKCLNKRVAEYCCCGCCSCTYAEIMAGVLVDVYPNLWECLLKVTHQLVPT